MTSSTATAVKYDVTPELNTLFSIRSLIPGAYNVNASPGHIDLQGHAGGGLERAIERLGLTYETTTEGALQQYHAYTGTYAGLDVRVVLSADKDAS